MKEKYSVKETNGWWYEGKFYVEGSLVELSRSEFAVLKDQVRLEPAAVKGN
jgi:hypothetical protein